jgi:hypothetical protein
MIFPMTAEGARSIAPQLRELDLALMRDLSYHDDPEHYCESRIELPGPKWMMAHAGTIYAIGGLQMTCPGTLTGWVVATRGWEAHKFEAIRYMRMVIRGAIESGAAKRVQGWVLAENAGANRMAEVVGLRLEARLARLADGNDVNVYARVAPW